ncbi:MAG: hypothetical protein R3D52_05610 [Xanthobacteraceae bacterium]
MHLGSYPLERLKRQESLPDLSNVPPMRALAFTDEQNPVSIANAMARFIGMFDAIRDGVVAQHAGEISEDPIERANHLKAAGYFFDSSQVGVCAIPQEAFLSEPIHNPALESLVEELSKGQPKTFSSGIDVIYADVLDSARTKPTPIPHHQFALVVLVEYTREPRPGEPGTDWIAGVQPQRAAVLAAQTAVLLSNYLRLLGHEARAHTATSSDVHLGMLAVAAGLAQAVALDGSVTLINPYVGRRFGLAAVTTTMALAPDRPLAPAHWLDRMRSHGPAWWIGTGTGKSALNRDPYRRREFRMGAHPFEKLERRETPTTFIDALRVPRFPKRADFFARALFGDMGEAVQEGAKTACTCSRARSGIALAARSGRCCCCSSAMPAGRFRRQRAIRNGTRTTSRPPLITCPRMPSVCRRRRPGLTIRMTPAAIRSSPITRMLSRS